MSELITSLDPDFMATWAKEIEGQIPEEKAQAELRQQRNARIMEQAGSVAIDGIGQKVAEIDARLFFRMRASFGHEDNWLQDFLADCPELCAPGYRPKRKGDLRHAKTFVGGKPV